MDCSWPLEVASLSTLLVTASLPCYCRGSCIPVKPVYIQGYLEKVLPSFYDEIIALPDIVRKVDIIQNTVGKLLDDFLFGTSGSAVNSCARSQLPSCINMRVALPEWLLYATHFAKVPLFYSRHTENDV